jgi:hypothetical protein
VTTRNTLTRLVVSMTITGVLICWMNGGWTTRGFIAGALGWCFAELVWRVLLRRKRTN